ncbi:hypothetical protein SUGI_0185440 [Cryptomeria japonica]|uniref:uncharacterized protein LOC131051602 n=1 Tax=Cryptomeria japonica TaxID=3369 RepID=UPI00240898A1|nr:uncharacterized protein LOC131051602 [Cryptomeria japonica]GLJ12147.1 hypothetical protein SUGI_0185440 [Cryptomeria japonica]
MECDGCPECVLSLAVNETFDLEKAVCSYGFFMMPPNLWLSSSSTLRRPLRLSDATTRMVYISQQKSPSSSLQIRVMDTSNLTTQDQQYLLDQVVRMLRLSEMQESEVRGFHALHPEAKAKGFGRIFRSPTLFEDMVKSMLLCNCGWARTLTMNRLLCDLQSELKEQPLGGSTIQEISSNSNGTCVNSDDSSPKTPNKKDGKRKRCSKKPSNNAVSSVPARFSEQGLPFTDVKKTIVSEASSITLIDIEKSAMNLDIGLCQEGENNHPLKISTVNLSEIISSPESLTEEYCIPSALSTGDFPTPKELASFDEAFLAKRCCLGYRAKRILHLATDICNGTIDLNSLESSDGSPLLKFSELEEFFLKLKGFGPFTSSNVLMCMGYFEIVPADSETVRHLKKVHSRFQCTIGTVAKEVEEVYARYSPFQFLAYWCEMWDCYEEKFGKLSQMPPSHYHLITGSNMRKEVSKYFINQMPPSDYHLITGSNMRKEVSKYFINQMPPSDYHLITGNNIRKNVSKYFM